MSEAQKTASNVSEDTVRKLVEALGEPVFRKDKSTGDWYCWCETCCSARELLSTPELAPYREE